MRTKQATADPAYGNQHTAASSSIRQLWASMLTTALLRMVEYDTQTDNVK
ncbi:MAG: hypothetical protein OSB26_05690 [Woeseiaceae bacterium]|jgi:hypothetical protein|nr:hypothetical protein [Woeseiaceae bacterium]